QQVNNQWQWTSGFWNVASQPEVQYYPQPPQPVENGPSTPPPGPNYVYAPGVYVWAQTGYAWRPGFWYVHRPPWVYPPAHYALTPYGYVFVDAYWDYPLRDRGVLFTPVYIPTTVYVRQPWIYRPSYVVYDDALYGSLFVRAGGGYYFGDYFDVRYTNIGYRSAFSISIGIGGCGGSPVEPVVGYYPPSDRPRL